MTHYREGKGKGSALESYCILLMVAGDDPMYKGTSERLSAGKLWQIVNGGRCMVATGGSADFHRLEFPFLLSIHLKHAK